MKKSFVIFSLSLAALAGAAQRYDSGISDLIRRERLSPQEAATVYAISRGLGIDTYQVLRERNVPLAHVWDLAPAFYISQKTRLSVREIWDLHRRGADWQDIESGRYDYRGRGRNDNGRGGYYDDGYDNGGYRQGDPVAPGRPDRQGDQGRRQGDQGYGRDNRQQGDLGDILRRRDDQYGRNGRYDRDDAYVERVWRQMLGRAFNSRAIGDWSWIRKGLYPNDLALAAHVSLITGADPDDVLYELSRTHNWEQVKRTFHVSNDWSRQDGRYRYDRRRG